MAALVESRPAPQRVTYMDWLRILAVLLLIPFHTARVFDIFDQFYIKNAEVSTWLSWGIIVFLERWQMPLLFLIAGASTWYALRSRGGGGYAIERLKRLMVPFVFGTLVLVPPQMYYALLHRSSTSASFPAYYPSFFSMRPDDQLTNDYIGVGFSWAHLWFIIDLFIIAIVVLPLLLYLRGARGQRIVSGLAGFFERRGTILLPGLLFFLLGDLPEFLGQPIFLYLVVFIFGFLLVSNPRFSRGIARSKEVALGLGVITLSIIYTVWMSGGEPIEDTLEDALFYLLRCINLWSLLIAILGYGQRYLNAENRVLSYARNAAYPFYVLHQTVIIAIAYYVVQWKVDLSIKYFAIVVAALIATIATYDVLVKRTNVTRLLFGMKPIAKTSLPEVASPTGKKAA